MHSPSEHVLTIQAETLESRRAAYLQGVQGVREKYERDLIPYVRPLYPMFLDWKRTIGRDAKKDRSEFARWVGANTGNFYNHLYASRALFEGWTGTAVSALAPIGQALWEGWTPERIREVLGEKHNLDALREALRTHEKESFVRTVLSLPSTNKDALTDALKVTREARAITRSEAPLGDPEVAAAMLGAWQLLPEWERDGALSAFLTGEELTDAVRAAFLESVRFRSWLAERPCCKCGRKGVHLHHVHLPDIQAFEMAAGGRHFQDIARELLVPLCPSCHLYATDAVHQRDQAELAVAFFGRPDAWYIIGATLTTRFYLEKGIL